MPITLSGGAIQGPSNIPVPNGYMTMVLSGDTTVANPQHGNVMSLIPVTIWFDSSGNILNPQPTRVQPGQPAPTYAGAAPTPYSNAELAATTWYVVNFFTASGARVNAKALIWQFTQAAGSVVDIGYSTPAVFGLLLEAGSGFLLLEQ